jgi:hypothetical protein
MTYSQSLVFAGDYYPDAPFVVNERSRESIVVANLETVIGETASKRTLKAYTVVLGDEAYKHVSESGVAAFNIANNHVYDAGHQTFDSMITRLRDMSHIQFFGLHDKPYAEFLLGSYRCAIIGCLERCRARGPRLFPSEHVGSLIRSIRGDFDRIYVTPHWGKASEFAYYPAPSQRRLAKEWLDCGADGVFGHHPHVIQGRERLDCKEVFYSLGNYQFDHIEGHDYPASYWGLTVQVTPSAAVDAFVPMFHFQERGLALLASEEIARKLYQHFEEISYDLTRNVTGTVDWCRAVGPVFIAKSRNSWRKRFRTHFFRTLPLWLLWNVLPETLFLRFGACLPDANIQEKINSHNATLEFFRMAMRQATDLQRSRNLQ